MGNYTWSAHHHRTQHAKNDFITITSFSHLLQPRYSSCSSKVNEEELGTAALWMFGSIIGFCSCFKEAMISPKLGLNLGSLSKPSNNHYRPHLNSLRKQESYGIILSTTNLRLPTLPDDICNPRFDKIWDFKSPMLKPNRPNNLHWVHFPPWLL